MRLVVAIGGNALLERGDLPSAEIQEHHVCLAVEHLRPLAIEHELVVTHGNGPQVGLLALESARDPDLVRPYPFDVLGAQTQGMIGYFLLQALENACPEREVAGLICQTEVARDDPAFSVPTKFVGPRYTKAEAEVLVERWGWQLEADDSSLRRVVASPEPRCIIELSTIAMLLDGGAIVICAGGGGVPVVRAEGGSLVGVEAVIDKDLTAGLLAEQLDADALMLLTDVAAVEDAFGTASARQIRTGTPSSLRARSFPAGSMGPKVEAACRFVERTGRRAMIGHLTDAAGLLAGTSGTVVEPDER